MPAVIASLSRNPLYLQLAQAIEKEIAEGRWPLNKAIPSETQLATDFGVSVGTVRKALDILSDRGRLVKKQGSGTYAKSYADAGFWNRFQRYQYADGRITHFKGTVVLFETVPAPAPVARLLGLTEGDRVIHVARTMKSVNALPGDGDGAGLDISWLPADLFQNLTPKAYEQDLSLYAIYEAVCGVVICDVSDRLDIVNQLPAETPINYHAEGPFFRLRRTARTFSAKTVEYRIEHAACRGLQVALD